MSDLTTYLNKTAENLSIPSGPINKISLMLWDVYWALWLCLTSQLEVHHQNGVHHSLKVDMRRSSWLGHWTRTKIIWSYGPTWRLRVRSASSFADQLPPLDDLMLAMAFDKSYATRILQSKDILHRSCLPTLTHLPCLLLFGQQAAESDCKWCHRIFQVVAMQLFV